jgi:hypothetical protein
MVALARLQRLCLHHVLASLARCSCCVAAEGCNTAVARRGFEPLTSSLKAMRSREAASLRIHWSSSTSRFRHARQRSGRAKTKNVRRAAGRLNFEPATSPPACAARVQRILGNLRRVTWSRHGAVLRPLRLCPARLQCLRADYDRRDLHGQRSSEALRLHALRERGPRAERAAAQKAVRLRVQRARATLESRRRRAARRPAESPIRAAGPRRATCGVAAETLGRRLDSRPRCR